ncbi:MAG TPA: hypothetical protein VEG08_08855 [Terriglobales bacterium]|nr:hypothetical protein [Terriglobales bacterium]
MSRALGFIAVLLVVVAGAWYYLKSTQSASPAGTSNPTATVNLAGVKNDLIALGEAERRHFASEGKYVSIDDLRSAGDISMPSNRRGPYTYSADVTATGFRITATCSGACAGLPASFSIDETMQISSQ